MLPLIPLYMWASLGMTIAILHYVFPGLFPTVGNNIKSGWVWTQGTYHIARKHAFKVLLWSTVGLTVYSLLIFLAVYFSWSGLLVFAFIGNAIAVTLLVIMMYMVRAGAKVGFKILARIARFGRALALVTAPFDRQPIHMKLIMLASSPVYGLYLLFALPLRISLEVVRLVYGLNRTVSRWLKLWVSVFAAIAISQFFLCMLAFVQLRSGRPILTLTFFLLVTVFALVLTNVLFLGGRKQIPLIEFFENLGYLTLLLCGFLGLDSLFPELTDPISHTLSKWYHGMMQQLGINTLVAFLVIMVVALGVSLAIPWCRRFAPLVASSVALLFVLSGAWTTYVRSARTSIPEPAIEKADDIRQKIIADQIRLLDPEIKKYQDITAVRKPSLAETEVYTKQYAELGRLNQQLKEITNSGTSTNFRPTLGSALWALVGIGALVAGILMLKWGVKNWSTASTNATTSSPAQGAPSAGHDNHPGNNKSSSWSWGAFAQCLGGVLLVIVGVIFFSQGVSAATIVSTPSSESSPAPTDFTKYVWPTVNTSPVPALLTPPWDHQRENGVEVVTVPSVAEVVITGFTPGQTINITEVSGLVHIDPDDYFYVGPQGGNLPQDLPAASLPQEYKYQNIGIGGLVLENGVPGPLWRKGPIVVSGTSLRFEINRRTVRHQVPPNGVFVVKYTK